MLVPVDRASHLDKPTEGSAHIAKRFEGFPM